MYGSSKIFDASVVKFFFFSHHSLFTTMSLQSLMVCLASCQNRSCGPINLASHLDLCEAGRLPPQLTSLGQIFDWGRIALRAFAHYLSSPTLLVVC